jgi:hypothetical protein
MPARSAADCRQTNGARPLGALAPLMTAVARLYFTTNNTRRFFELCGS